MASKTDKRLDEIQGHLTNVDDHVHNVHRGGKDIKSMQEMEIDLTKKVSILWF